MSKENEKYFIYLDWIPLRCDPSIQETTNNASKNRDKQREKNRRNTKKNTLFPTDPWWSRIECEFKCVYVFARQTKGTIYEVSCTQENPLTAFKATKAKHLTSIKIRKIESFIRIVQNGIYWLIEYFSFCFTLPFMLE